MREIQEFMVKKFTHPRDKTHDLVKYCVKQGYLVSVSSADNSGVNRYMPKDQFEKACTEVQQAMLESHPDPAQQIASELSETAQNIKEALNLTEDPAPYTAETVNETPPEPLNINDPENLAVIYPETTYNVMFNGKMINNMIPGQPWNGITELIAFSEEMKEPFKILFQNWSKHNGKIIAANDAAIEYLELKNVGRL
jgi:hypothetical protein